MKEHFVTCEQDNFTSGWLLILHVNYIFHLRNILHLMWIIRIHLYDSFCTCGVEFQFVETFWIYFHIIMPLYLSSSEILPGLPVKGSQVWVTALTPDFMLLFKRHVSRWAHVLLKVAEPPNGSFNLTWPNSDSGFSSKCWIQWVQTAGCKLVETEDILNTSTFLSCVDLLCWF